ncbi:MAG: ABC transporter ATP-binding protein, partial [Gammaproteobacteria bacterium]
MSMSAPPRGVYELYRLILKPERRFYVLMLVYGVAVSALSLSVPLSVQVLIGTVVNSALVNQVIVLAIVLFALLGLSGLFAAVQVYLMELFERRFFSRIVSEVTLRLVYAEPNHMASINRDELVNRYFDI